MTDKSFSFFAAGAIISAILSAIVLYSSVSFAAAPPGITANAATSSNPAIGTTATLIFATSTCQARVVTTRTNPILVYFSDFKGQRPTGGAGHWQAASTTVTYDASIFGCNAVYAYSYATDALTVTEFR